MAKQLNDLGKLCLALGVDDPNTVTRVVVDIRPGHHPMLYVERIGDAERILAALSAPGIELRRESTRFSCVLRVPHPPHELRGPLHDDRDYLCNGDGSPLKDVSTMDGVPASAGTPQTPCWGAEFGGQ